MSPTPVLYLAVRKCSQCLTTRNRIVSGQRAAEIIRECRNTDNHFVCHKADGQIVHCRGVHDIMGGSRAARMARRFKFPVVELDMDS